MKKWVIVAALLSPALAIGAEGRVVEEVVAVVNGDAVLKSDYDAAASSLYRSLATRYSGDELKSQFERAQGALLDTLIEETLLLQEARAKNFDVGPEIEGLMERLKRENNIQDDADLERALAAEGFTIEGYKTLARERLIKRHLIAQEVESKVDVSEEELQNYYASHQKEFETKERVRLREIVISSKERGTEEAARLAAEVQTRVSTGGEDFATVATSASEAPSKDQGGDLGWIETTDLAQSLRDTIEKLSPGDVTGVMSTEDGARIVKLEERQPATIPKFDEVQASIDRKLKEQKTDAEVRAYVERLKSESYIFKPERR